MNDRPNAAVTAVLVSFAWMVADAVMAQAADSTEAAVAAVVQEAKSRLDLTPDQEAALRPVVEARNARLAEIRGKFAGDDSRRGRRAMFREAETVLKNYWARVRTLLDDSQVAEWEKIGEEAEDRLKRQYKAGDEPS
jgi:hypothetical protein